MDKGPPCDRVLYSPKRFLRIEIARSLRARRKKHRYKFLVRRARNDRVRVILLYNPGNSFSLTGTRKPSRDSAIYEM